MIALATGCADLPLVGGAPERLPGAVHIEVGAQLMVTGESVPLHFRLSDHEGVPFERLPPWAVPLWTATPDIVRIEDGRLEALESGEAMVSLRVAGLDAHTTIRVNPSALRVAVLGAYVTQGIQRFDGTVPLVAGRDAHVRVFVSADQRNFFRPAVRVHFYSDGQHVTTLSAQAADEGIPTVVDEHLLGRSWNVPVPGSLIAPGAAFLVEVPAAEVPSAPGSVLHFPESALPEPLPAHALAPLRVTFVPIHIIDFATGNVHPGNVDEYTRATRQVWPVHETDIVVREPYSTQTQSATGEDWNALLREIRVLRVVEGAALRYYHGIVRRQGAWAGLAYIGYPAAVSFDNLPGASWTVAHEFGHNFGRRHAPCGNPAGVDPNFPYQGAGIGAYGLSIDGSLVFGPDQRRDLMSYCTPRWVSDYSFEAVFELRLAQAAVDTMSGGAGIAGGAAASGAGPTLVVSGELAPDGLRLDPAFTVPGVPAVVPAEPGPYTLDGLDAAGTALFTLSFAGEELGDGPPDRRHFAFALPLAAGVADRLTRLRLRGAGLVAERVSTLDATDRLALQAPGGPGSEPRFTVERSAPGYVSLRWPATRFPLVVVRNPATGAVLGLARDGTATLRTDATALELTFSDGVASIVRPAAVVAR